MKFHFRKSAEPLVIRKQVYKACSVEHRMGKLKLDLCMKYLSRDCVNISILDSSSIKLILLKEQQKKVSVFMQIFVVPVCCFIKHEK